MVHLIVAIFALASATAPSVPYMAPDTAVFEVGTADPARTYKLYIKTPPGYDRTEESGRAYPVIYLNDGDLHFMTAAGETLLPYYNKAAAPVIIVGISYAKGEDAIASRQLDYTPAKDASFKNETGGAGRYLDFLKNSIIPFVEERYRIDSNRRAIAGHSLGATFAAYALFEHPGLFSDYIIISPALWFGGNAIANLEDGYSKAHSDLAARVFIAVGDLESPKGGLKRVNMVNDAQAFAVRLRSRDYGGLELRSEVLKGGVNHATSFAAGFARALLVLYPPAK
ncbi:MAG: alpha/beta hydrolase-fold protein [Parvularculaceae bacterium]